MSSKRSAPKRSSAKSPSVLKPVTQKLNSLPFADKVTLGWFVIDAFTHLTIEFGYLYLALTTTAKESSSFMAKIWNEYARADSRWNVRDEGIISVEMATVAVGVLCLFQIAGVFSGASWRHPLQIVISVCELYGGWMTFAPEWFSNPPNQHLLVSVRGEDRGELLWIYLWFMNGLWVLVPIVMLWDSWAALARKSCAPPSRSIWWGIVALISLYGVIVPAVLIRKISIF